MKTVHTQISASWETVLMHAGQQSVEQMQFAAALITELNALAFMDLREILSLHADHVRYDPKSIEQSNMEFVLWNLRHVCMFFFSAPTN